MIGRRSVVVALLSIAAAFALPATASAQDVDCGEYLGLVCEGLFTDEPNLTSNPDSHEASIARVSGTHGNPIAIVIARDARGYDPVDFAVDLANDWGVGDPVEENGILVLVAVAERRTEVVTQAGIDLPGSTIANTARSFFAADDFDGGVNAIIGALDVILSGGEISSSGSDDSGAGGGFGWVVMVGIGATAAVITWGSRRQARRAKRERIRIVRTRAIDKALAELEPRGDEIDLACR